MKLAEVAAELPPNLKATRPSEEQATEKLAQAGYRRIGWGSFSQVWAKKGDPFVVKLFRDEAYRRYTEFVARHQDNQHFPRLRGRPIGMSDYYAVRIERLTRNAPWMIATQISHLRVAIGVIRKGVEALMQEDVLNRPEQEWRDWVAHSQEVRQNMAAQYPSIVQAVEIIDAELIATGLGSWDFSDGNLRMRKNVLVFSDPIIMPYNKAA